MTKSRGINLHRFKKEKRVLLVPISFAMNLVKTTPSDAADITDHPVLEIQLLYGTDRKRLTSRGPEGRFRNTRGNQLIYGTCVVSIPRDHKMGALESPKWYFPLNNNERHVVLRSVQDMTRDLWIALLREQIKTDSGKQVLVFVHGYNVTFKDAARRAAQITYDLAFSGVSAFYSWPSRGRTTAYPPDEASIEAAQPYLTQFLTDLAITSKAKKIYVIAHSMGNRAVTKAIADIVSQSPNLALVFSKVILTAPDIDADYFRNHIGPQLIKAGLNVTLYASANDKALQASKAFHASPRAGDSGKHLVVLKGLDTIDASLLDTTFGGHSYYADNRSVLADIFYLIRGLAPQKRHGLRQVPLHSHYYFVFRP